MRFFNKEPTIEWDKVYCPICGNPSGPSSKCYEQAPANMPAHKRKILSKHSGIIPIYSKACVFRQDNLWEGSINYPVSKPLINRLAKIEGIDKLVPTKPHSFHISISKSFNEAEVRRKVNTVYKAFINEMQSKELGDVEYPQNMEQYSGIRLPNGNVVNLENASKEMQSILDNIPGATGIPLKGNDHGSKSN